MMIEVYGNLWEYKADIRVITTNGTIKKDGNAVLGRGCAREATSRYPLLPSELGERLARFGNVLHSFPHYNLITFPVKHNWWEQANMILIISAALELKNLADINRDKVYVMPRAGCGNGKLEWDDVKLTLEAILPNNVHVITFMER